MTDELKLKPIGHIVTPRRLKFDAPHQPEKSSKEVCEIKLNAKSNFEQALTDLAGFERVWLIWWFHRNKSWKPLVMPPRGGEKRRGVFATRSPHRPNPIGLTAVPLIKVEGRSVWVGANDLLDGTPILDIKPYIRTIDAFPDASCGWLEELEKSLAGAPEYSVIYSEKARIQLQWLEDQGINIADQAEKILTRDPSPHRTRRITKHANGLHRMGCGAWRMLYYVDKKQVQVESIEPGYPAPDLRAPKKPPIPYRKEQLAFFEMFGGDN